MIPEDVPRINKSHIDGEYAGQANHLNRRPSAMPDIRIPLNARIIPKQLADKAILVNATKVQGKKKKKTQEKKADKKAAKTLSAILLTFIITWTPYNILVLLKPVTSSHRIPPQLWDFFYYLCYINSTINPMCYALCNASFRRTYLRILQCKWHNRNRAAVNRGFYNWFHSTIPLNHRGWTFRCFYICIMYLYVPIQLKSCSIHRARTTDII